MDDTETKTDENGVYIVIKNADDPSAAKYKNTRKIQILSILHLISGAVIFFLDLLNIFINPEKKESTELGFCSTLFIMTGILGFISIKRTTSCKISAFMVFCILSSIIGGLLCLHLIAFGVRFDYNWLYLSVALCLFVECILGIVSSAFSCQACCGCCGQSGEASESSVVYIAAPEDNGAGQPRVVHLNMNEVRKQKHIDHHIVLDSENNLECTAQQGENESKQDGNYTRFK